MLEVKFRRDSRQRLSSVFASGHTEFADRGEDLVCAAASAILQAAWLGLTDHAKIAVAAERSEGRLALRWSEADREDPAVRAIVATAELAINHLAVQYPEHLRSTSEVEPETK